MVNDVKAVSHLHLLTLLIACKCFFDLDPVFVRKPAQRIYIAILFMFHQKADGIPTFSTAKTFINFF